LRGANRSADNTPHPQTAGLRPEAGVLMFEQLLIVTTGGTIDKIYFDDKSDYQVGEPQIGRILEELGVGFRFSVIPIIRKDSLHISEADRELIRATIAAQEARHVLVTHGTDTMVDTAKVLAQIPGKTIVLTGALSPARFRGSDTEFNVGCAVGAVQSMPPGVYIAMNGRVWDPFKVRKNVAANRFEAAD
jgi:L-asparaginase